MSKFLHLPLLLIATLNLQAQAPNLQRAVLSIERIWDRAPHSAFTDLVYFQDKFYCTFREGTGHIPGINGSIRVIASDDGQNWYSVALLMENGVDLRDPKLSVTPDKRLMLTIGGSFYEGKTLLKQEPRVSFSDKKGRRFSDPRQVTVPAELASDRDWLWRVTWHKGVGYGGLYQAGGEEWKLHLVKTTDGLRYELVTTFDLQGRPNETSLRFGPGDEMLAMVRRESGDTKGMLGSSKPPYLSWDWKSIDARLGGPNFLLLPAGKWLCATRDYEQKEHRTALAIVDPAGSYKKVVVLPSGGDTSYPGMVIQDGILYLSYYSGHEGKTNIYLARLSVAELMKLPASAE